MSGQNGMEEVSIIDVQKKIEDMKNIKSSLMREINQNQLEAMRNREILQAQTSKIDEQKQKIASLEQLILKRQEEMVGMDSKLSKESRQIEAERRDMIKLRETVGNEQILWVKEKQMQNDALNEERTKLARLEMSLNTREQDLRHREKEVTALLADANRRLIVVDGKEQTVESKLAEAQNAVKEADQKLRDANKLNDDVEASRVRYESMEKEFKEKMSQFTEKDSHIRTCYDDIEVQRNTLKEREREVVIEESRVKAIKDKLHKELQYAALTREKKDEYKKELDG